MRIVETIILDACWVMSKSVVFYAYGYNKYEMSMNHDTIHAEVDATMKLKKSDKLKPIDVFVFRIDKTFEKNMLAKPCENCINYMKINLARKNYKLRKIYFTKHDEIIDSI